MKIYLDNCCYNRPFDDQEQPRILLEMQAKLLIQKFIINKKFELAFSYISRYENIDNPHKGKREAIDSFFINASVYIGNDKAKEAENMAKEIMPMNIRGKDALHLSCAILAGCDAFVTTDDDVIKRYKSNDIIVCSPITFFEKFGGKINA